MDPLWTVAASFWDDHCKITASPQSNNLIDTSLRVTLSGIYGKGLPLYFHQKCPLFSRSPTGRTRAKLLCPSYLQTSWTSSYGSRHTWPVSQLVVPDNLTPFIHLAHPTDLYAPCAASGHMPFLFPSLIHLPQYRQKESSDPPPPTIVWETEPGLLQPAWLADG